jgi:hypothetical protein
MTLLIAAIVLAVVGTWWVVHPLVYRRWGLLTDAVSSALVVRETRKRVALAALKEVEFDRAAGKLDDADYESLKGQLELEALHAVRVADAPDAIQGKASAARHVCGFKNPASSRFCAGCGQPLA